MWYYPFSALVIALTSASLGVLIISKKRSPLHNSFFLFCFFMVVWSYSYFRWQLSDTYETALFWTRALTVGSVFIPISYLHYVLVFTGEYKRRKKLLIFGYLLFGVYFLFDFTPLMVRTVEPFLSFRYWPKPGPVYNIYLATLFLNFIYCFYLLYRTYRRSRGIIREQAKFILLGTYISLAGASLNWLPWYDIPVPPFTNILSGLFVVFTAYTIVRHRFLDIKIIFHRSSVLIASITIVTIVYLTIRLLIIRYIDNGLVFEILLLIALLILFPRIQSYLFRMANKYFFSTLYDSDKIITDLSYRLRSTLEPAELLAYINDTLTEAFHIKSFALLRFNTSEQTYESQRGFGLATGETIALRADQDLHQAKIKKNEPIVTEEIKERDYRRNKKFIDDLGKYQIEVLVPMNIKYHNLGILAIGGKESEEIFNNEDLRLLKIIGGLAASAVGNAQAYSDLKEKSLRLEELLEMKREFLRIVHHQLNTPLSIMKFSLTSIEEKTMSEKEGLESFRAGLERMGNTIADMWEAYELEGEGVEVETRVFDVMNIVVRLIEEKQRLSITQGRKLKINIKPPDESTPLVVGDEKKITHAISNVLDNAVFYTVKGRVDISFELKTVEDNTYWTVLVSDSGIGIPEEDQATIFDKFTRGENATTAHPDGSGIGLYIAKRIIEANRGKLRLERSTPDRGSTFGIYLPIKK